MKDTTELAAEVEKLRKGLGMLPWVAIVVGASSLLQYAGIFSLGFIPPWVGLAWVALVPLQWWLINRKITKLEAEIHNG